jgi:hypothetical protein
MANIYLSKNGEVFRVRCVKLTKVEFVEKWMNRVGYLK